MYGSAGIADIGNLTNPTCPVIDLTTSKVISLERAPLQTSHIVDRRMNVVLRCIVVDGGQSTPTQAQAQQQQHRNNNFNVELKAADLDLESSTVDDLKALVLRRFESNHKQRHNGSSAYNVDIVIAGQFVAPDRRLCDLDIGPTTNLHVLIKPSATDAIDVKSHRSSTSNGSADNEWKPSFHVYCKNCERVQKGRLRVRCGQCESQAVVLRDEPDCWQVVLKRPSPLSCQCLHANCVDAHADFYFRCAACSDKGLESVCMPLPQVKANTGRAECAVCDEVLSPVVVFNCSGDEPCCLCLQCFIEFANVSLSERRFVLDGSFGYTLPCATPNCDGRIHDPHHFYILGRHFYSKYQTQATEYVLLEQRALYCPRPECGMPFLLDAPHPLVMCPECGHSFCSLCAQSSSNCLCQLQDEPTDDDASGPDSTATTATSGSRAIRPRRSRESRETAASLSMIRATCRPCPKCQTATERNGGCAHITCRQCAADWCWVCHAPWTDQCQWDHWFD